MIECRQDNKLQWCQNLILIFFNAKVGLIEGDWCNCHTYHLWKTQYYISCYQQCNVMDERCFFGKINNINGHVTKVFVDLIIVDMRDGIPIHGINEGRSILLGCNWKQMNGGRRSINLLDSILSENACTLIMCNAKMTRLQEKIMSYPLGTIDHLSKFV